MMNNNPVQKLVGLKDRAKSNIDDCVNLIEWVDRDEKRGVLTKEEAEGYKKSYNNSIKQYKGNISLVDKFFKQHPYLNF